jgi:N-acyl homoserine lactone hydrolase
MANKQPTIELNGDLDLFGDGGVYIHRAVSHTPGSQIALIRLPKTGLIVLTSDVCYLKESLDKDILPSIGLTYDPTGMLDAYHYIKQAVDREKGDVIFAHDPDTFKAHRLRLSSTNSRLIFQSMPSTRAADLCCRPAFLGSR